MKKVILFLVIGFTGTSCLAISDFITFGNTTSYQLSVQPIYASNTQILNIPTDATIIESRSTAPISRTWSDSLGNKGTLSQLVVRYISADNKTELKNTINLPAKQSRNIYYISTSYADNIFSQTLPIMVNVTY